MSESTSSTKPELDASQPDSAQSELSAALAFVLPFIMFMLIGALYPKFTSLDLEHISTPETLSVEEINESRIVADAKTQKYFWLIGVQVVVGFSLLVYFHKTYLRQFPFRLSWLAVIVGLLGGVLWIGVCEIGLERRILQWVGLGQWAQTRASFNPVEYIQNNSHRKMFFVLRFTLLALIVPIVEELFLRGWFARWFVNPDWQTVALKEITRAGVMAIAAYAVLTHPGEAIAAVLWFSFVSWLMLRTGNLWDCVLAHAITNLMLGLFVVSYDAWHLW